ncbi:hypothetical protein [Williamsia soli]|uniref:hypothetical protein n=1 Tax=Williamsia soli TaxID=364929 RepID=UPI001A9DF2BA|nr:hypothetical protein [Williamsia soli]
MLLTQLHARPGFCYQRGGHGCAGYQIAAWHPGLIALTRPPALVSMEMERSMETAVRAPRNHP